MPYVPRHQKQLVRGIPVPGRTTGSRDCGPRTIQMGIDFLTKGDLVVGIADLRKRMGRPGPQPTNVQNAKTGVESYRKPKVNRKPLKYYIKTRISDLAPAVAKGKYAQLAIDYGKFNDLMFKTGDPNFRGGHSVGVLGQRKKNGVVQWLLFDPLDDGRRSNIPKGPRWVPKWKLVRAMESFAGGKNRCYAGVFSGGGKK